MLSARRRQTPTPHACWRPSPPAAGTALRAARPAAYARRREALAAVLRLLFFFGGPAGAFALAFSADTRGWEGARPWVRAGLLFPLALAYCSQVPIVVYV